MNYPGIFSIPSICVHLGITNAVICPGSRSAPLTIAFARNKAISCRVIPDERSAAFIALGMAQQLKRPVVLICTSGSAALNFAPAIAEGFFQQIPLIVLTADRPPEWIDQLDGQTIRQDKIYGDHVKISYSVSVDQTSKDAQWHTQRLLSEAINIATEFPNGPVHLNFPFREPFYPESLTTDEVDYKAIVQKNTIPTLDQDTIKHLAKSWSGFNRKLIICGQNLSESKELKLLEQLIKSQKIPVVGDIISNIHSCEDVILHSDIFLGSNKSGLQESMKPDLLVTFGKSILSKNLKETIRKFKPDQHWHIQEAGVSADTYQSLTHVFKTSPEQFLNALNDIKNEQDFNSQKQENYFHIWQIEERKALRVIKDFFPIGSSLGEFEMVKNILLKIPDYSNLHLANSMAVRYANFIGLNKSNATVKVFSNRGTSGIDGCNSTTVGSCFETDKLNILITGDMAFLYDRNAFWHNYPIPNLRILVLNNHGGGIFRIIKGPAQQPELEEYFETKQNLKAGSLAKEFGMDYFLCDKRSKLDNYLNQFLEDDGNPKILELESDSADNKSILESFKTAFNDLK